MITWGKTRFLLFFHYKGEIQSVQTGFRRREGVTRWSSNLVKRKGKGLFVFTRLRGKSEVPKMGWDRSQMCKDSTWS